MSVAESGTMTVETANVPSPSLVSVMSDVKSVVPAVESSGWGVEPSSVPDGGNRDVPSPAVPKLVPPPTLEGVDVPSDADDDELAGVLVPPPVPPSVLDADDDELLELEPPPLGGSPVIYPAKTRKSVGVVVMLWPRLWVRTSLRS